MKIVIQLADYSEKPLIKKMLELYSYDFSEFEGGDLDELGDYGYLYLDHYWEELERYPFIIRVDGNLAGFVLVNSCGHIEGIKQSIAEFFILRKYRKNGIGQHVAFDVFDRFLGLWEVKALNENEVATSFWRKVITAYSAETMREFKDGAGDWSGPIWTFEGKK